MAEYLSESYGYEFVYEDEIEGGEYDRNHDHHNSTAADPKKEHQEEGGVFTTMKNTVKQVASNIVKTDSEKLAVSEALLRWIDAKNGSAKDNIVANVCTSYRTLFPPPLSPPPPSPIPSSLLPFAPCSKRKRSKIWETVTFWRAFPPCFPPPSLTPRHQLSTR